MIHVSEVLVIVDGSIAATVFLTRSPSPATFRYLGIWSFKIRYVLVETFKIYKIVPL